MTSRLTTSGLCFSAGPTLLLGPITADVTLSGITAILGPNGAGKSLFLSLCHGALNPSAGTVNWTEGPAVSTRKTRGMMRQNPTILRRSVAKNIEFALQSHGVTNPTRKTRTNEVLAWTRLEHRAQAPAGSLSGGELRRMALARALVTKPKVLILDEPFAGLDPAALSEVETLITDISGSIPVLLANHDLAQTARIANQVLFFAGGKLIEHANCQRFFDAPKTPEAEKFLQGHRI